MDSWERWRGLLRGHRLPAAVVDLDALERNVDTLIDALGDSVVTLRVASKSVRHVGLLRRIMDRGGARLQGVMCYAAEEATVLAQHGFDDLLVAYPVSRPHQAAELAALAAAGHTVRAMVDEPGQAGLLAEAARAAGTEVAVCLDIDCSWRPLGELAHLGVRRSPIRAPDEAVRAATAIDRIDGVRLDALMFYEAQIAGVRDHNPTSRMLDPLRAVVKARSKPLVTALRAAVVDALRVAGVEAVLVNGGGTGSVRFTADDPGVTEVTAGSGFLCSHLFDGYRELPLLPAAFFALPVVRRSDPDHVTCLGGGYVASGVAGPDRLPVVHSPAGLAPLSMEGFGEVQTPFRWMGRGPLPCLGDPVVCRHAKAGELAERFATYLLVRGDTVVAEEPTYRGMGACFL